MGRGRFETEKSRGDTSEDAVEHEGNRGKRGIRERNRGRARNRKEKEARERKSRKERERRRERRGEEGETRGGENADTNAREHADERAKAPVALSGGGSIPHHHEIVTVQRGFTAHRPPELCVFRLAAL